MLGIIYKYTNRVDSKVYIGQTIRPHKRHLEHIRNKKNSRFTAAIKHYGIDSFDYEVIFSIENSNKEFIIPILNEKEMYYISFYKSNDINFGYNMTSGGEGVLNLVYTEEHRKKLSVSLTGRKWSDEHRKNFSLSRKGIKYDTKNLYGKHCKEVLQYTKDGNLVNKYSSLNDASKTMGTSPSNISVALHGRRKTALGFIWKFAN